MVNFKEALEIINAYDHEFDYCTEYDDAFVFGKSDDMSFGGWNSPAAVLKEDGSCINFVAYIAEGAGEVVREGYISDWEQSKERKRPAAKKRMRRGSEIDFAHVVGMSFKTYAYASIGGEVEVTLEDGVLRLCRGFSDSPDSMAPMAPALESKLTQLFAACGVSNWKRHYEPEGYVVLDGEGWDLKLTFKDGSFFRTGGENAWPEEFDKLEDGLMELFAS